MPSTPGRRAFDLTVIAFVWSIGLLLAALVAPVYGSATLVDDNGASVLLVVAVPAVISAAGVGDSRGCPRSRRTLSGGPPACSLRLEAFGVPKKSERTGAEEPP